MTIRSRRDVQRLMWVLTLSLAYYGVKGGIFTLRSGGVDRVWGPEGTFIGDNNAIALALIMTIPLLRYLQLRTQRRLLHLSLSVTMALSAIAALGSYSRGALLAIAAMIAFLWLKGRHKMTGAMLISLLTPLAFLCMPQSWSARMDSISSYQDDESAMGRINAWKMAWNLARDRFFGGGFDIADPLTFGLYAPNPSDIHAAHSIYFQALGEHGFVGLGLYLLLLWQAWRTANWITRNSRARADLEWAAQLATMIQASLAGFVVGGAFLSLLYFDVPYYLMAVLVATRILVHGHVRDSIATIPLPSKPSKPYYTPMPAAERP